MTLPTMLAGMNRELVSRWCAAIDAGPFRGLAAGERVSFDNLEMQSVLSFAAARTERVILTPTLIVLPMHPAAMVAKWLSTLDVLSGGRVEAVVGVGGRSHDYLCAERSFGARHATLDLQVATMRRIWAGEPLDDEVGAIGPVPVTPGGPRLLSGAMGPKSLGRAAMWADGNMGFSLAPDVEDHQASFRAVSDAWEAAGRDAPRLTTSFWYSIDPDAEAALRAYAYRYLRVFGHEAAEAMAAMCTAAGPAKLSLSLERLRDAGCDEVFLVPTTTDSAHLAEVATLVG